MKAKYLKIACCFTATLVMLSACNRGQGGDSAQQKMETTAAQVQSTTAAETSQSTLQFVEKDKKYKKDDTTDVLLDAVDLKKEDIVRVVAHGDHWHVFTKDGKEHITYKDPATIGEAGGELELVNVVSLAQLKGMNIKAIKVHGNHWHVFSEDGTEYLTYEDPSSLFRNVKVEQYTGNHGDHQKNKPNRQHTTTPGASDKVLKRTEQGNPEEIIKILKHGDHYHLYNRKGEEFVTYSDPRAMYPNAQFGEYVGEHGDHQHGRTTASTRTRTTTVTGLTETAVTTVGARTTTVVPGETTASTTAAVTTKATENSKPTFPIEFVPVVGLEKIKTLDVDKVLKHDDHYHVYTKQGKEYITYDNPSSVLPGIVIGEYKGKHGDHQNDTTVTTAAATTATTTTVADTTATTTTTADTTTTTTTKVNKVVRIAKHNDHWHVYHEDGTEEVTYTDPSPLYPGIKVEDFEGEHTHPVDDSEVFSYDDVKAERLVPFEHMSYGGMIYAVGFNEATQEFIVPHLSHFHNISIRTIISFAKGNDVFHGHSARAVVATMKWLLEHPDERPRKAGWGQDKDNSSIGDEESDESINAKLAFLRDYYGIEDRRDIMRIGSNFDVYIGGKTYEIPTSDLEYKDGKVTPVVELPKKAAAENNTPGSETTPTKNESPKNEDDSNKEVQPVKPTKPSTPNTDTNEKKQDEEQDKVAKYAKLYGMTTEEIEDQFFELLDITGLYFPLADLEFLDNGNVIIPGTDGKMIYNLKTLERVS